MIEEAIKLYEMLDKEGISPYLVNVRFISTIDMEMLEEVLDSCDTIVTLEENITVGGYGERLMSAIADNYEHNGRIMHIDGSICKGSVEHGEIKQLRRRLGIDAESLYERLKEKGVI